MTFPQRAHPQRVFSGVQPTGNLHLGNYLGAINQWVGMQHHYADCMFCIVDLHAITIPQEPAALRQATRDIAAAYIACGIDPGKNTIFVQSHVSGHAELAWLLSCHTPLGWLNRMTQFKEKAGKQKEGAPLGLYSYPVLMAADILLYQSTHVPVGEDQKQHLELTRDIAGAFNRAYSAEIFPLPEPMILSEAARVMSLRDGTKKMSKSDPSDMSRINLTDDADTIASKIRKAQTDTEAGITLEPDRRPAVANLLAIFGALSNQTAIQVAAHYASTNFSTFKNDLAELAVAKLSPITAEMNRLKQDTAYLETILQQGAHKAQERATPVLKTVKHAIGFLG